MKTHNGFLAFVLDQLEGIGHVVSRPMFGGVGLSPRAASLRRGTG